MLGGSTEQIVRYINALLDMAVERIPNLTLVRLLKATTAGLVVSALLIIATGVIGLVQQEQSSPVWLQNVRAAAIVYYHLIAGTAFVVGGIFVWYKFIRRGDDKPRIQPIVTGTAIIHGNVIYVVAVTKAQNTGLVEADLDVASSGLEISTTGIDDDEWNSRFIDTVFNNHNVVQPDELIEDQVWFEIPYRDEIAIRLDLSVALGEYRQYPNIEVISLLSQTTGNNDESE